MRLWVAAAGLVAIMGAAFHEYRDYKAFGNNLAAIAASCAAQGGCSLPLYDD
jgi:hypothetical protein